MASTNAHHASGWAAGVIAAALVTHAGAGGNYQLWSLAAMLAGMFGGTAPDWLERAWWRPGHHLWITHRTWTHWGVAWIALLVYSFNALGHNVAAPVFFGFAAGGVMHLFSDWPNPMGVPWIFRRHSLNLWRSGNCDFIIIGAAWLAAAVICDHVAFKDAHTLSLLNFLKPSHRL